MYRYTETCIFYIHTHNHGISDQVPQQQPSLIDDGAGSQLQRGRHGSKIKETQGFQGQCKLEPEGHLDTRMPT